MYQDVAPFLAPEVTIAAIICPCQVPMMYLKSPGEIVNDSRTYLGHTEAAAVDFAVILCAEVRFFIRI